MSQPSELLEGIVVRSTGSWHDVQVGADVIPSRIPGKFRLLDRDVTNPIAVGDRVSLRTNPDGTGSITAIGERRNKLSRRAAGRRAGLEHVIVANIDAAWCVQSVKLPHINPGFIDRFLVMAEWHEIPAGLILNKVDLLNQKKRTEIDFWHDLYRDLGYSVVYTSARTGAGIETLREQLEGKVNVVTGPSGVGKSTLLNAINPALNLRTQKVSAKTKKGRHTTTYAALHAIAKNGFVVDTPGIREFGIWDLDPSDLAAQFVEMLPYLDDCRFPNCTHDHEPGCAVKEAVDNARITSERYTSYLNILASLRAGDQDVGR